MAGKKNKAKNPPKRRGYIKRLHWLQLPQEIFQSRRYFYCNNYSSVTKTRVPAKSRLCGGHERPPLQLRRVQESAYLKYLPDGCHFTPQRVERVSDNMVSNSYNQAQSDMYELKLVDPFNFRRDPLFQNIERNSYMELTHMLYVNGKSYVLSLQGTLLVIEKSIDSVRTITGVASNRAIPSVSWRFFKEHLMELDGEIILVFLIHQESLGIVDGVGVFRLCLEKLKWIKAERLGGKVVCLDPGAVWMDSEESGCRGDRIYFTQASFSGWLVYDMKTHRISSV